MFRRIRNSCREGLCPHWNVRLSHAEAGEPPCSGNHRRSAPGQRCFEAHTHQSASVPRASPTAPAYRSSCWNERVRSAWLPRDPLLPDRDPDLADGRLHHLRVVAGGGAPDPDPVSRRGGGNDPAPLFRWWRRSCTCRSPAPAPSSTFHRCRHGPPQGGISPTDHPFWGSCDAGGFSFVITSGPLPLEIMEGLAS
jgi:hypothetical protein